MSTLTEICKHCYDMHGLHRHTDNACPVRDSMQPQRIIGYNEERAFEPSRDVKIYRHVATGSEAKGLALEMTDAQETTLGKIVGHLYYRTQLLNLIKHSGCPHNGGQHTLTIYGSRGDIVAFLDLAIDVFKNVKGAVYVLYALRAVAHEFERRSTTSANRKY